MVTWTFQVIVGYPLHVSQTTACRAIHVLSAFLLQNINDYLKFPNNIE